MKSSKSKSPYIGLGTLFWKLDKVFDFTCQETRLFFFLHDVANSTYWASEFQISDERAASMCKMSRETLKKSRARLVEAGLIKVTPGKQGRGSKTTYSFVACKDCEKQSDICKEEGCLLTSEEVKTQTFLKPAQAPVVAPTTQTISNPAKIENPAPSNEEVDLDSIVPPADDVNRNFDALKRNVRAIKATPAQALMLIKLSNFGEIGNPIWKCFSDIRESNGAIKQPVQFIFSRIKPQ